MAAITVNEVADTFNMPNYLGPLYMIKDNPNRLLAMIGNLTEGGRVEDNYEFGINTEELPAETQPAILEGADIPTPQSIGMTHTKNVTQIFNKSYGATYSKMASRGRIHTDSTHTTGVASADPDPFARQKALKVKQIRRQLNYTFINGVYQNPADATSTARKSRGLLAAVDSGHVVSAAGEQLSQDHIDLLLQTMFDNGALDSTENVVIVCNSYQKRRFSKIYGYAPEHRNIGGVNIQQIETDFGVFGIFVERDMPAAVVAVLNLGVVEPVYNLVTFPNGEVKGVLFSEPVQYQDGIQRTHLR